MNRAGVSFDGMSFRRRRQAIPFRLIAVLMCGVLFAAVWWLLPHEVAFWMLLVFVLALSWAATHGWRFPLRTLRSLLNRLESLED